MTKRAEGSFGSLRYLFGGDHPSQTTHQIVSSPIRGVSSQISQGWYFNSGSATTGVTASQPPTYPTHDLPENNIKL